MARNAKRVGGMHATHSGEQLVGEEVDSESAEREDGGIESEAKSYDVPVRPIKSEDALGLELVDGSGFAKSIFLFGSGFESPVNESANEADDASADGDEQRSLPTGFARRTAGIERLSAQLGELSAETDASRARVRLIPNAKLSSLPLNHFASAVVTAMICDSAPRPSRVRPATITGKLPRNAVRSAPRKQSPEKIRSDLRIPRRSIMMPPISEGNDRGQTV